MIEELKSIKSDKSELRKFGITMAIALAVIGAFFLWRGKPVYVYLFIISPFFLIFALLIPVILYPIQMIWMGIAVVMGFFMSRLILMILFYLIITPIGLVLRLFGKDFLNAKFRDRKDSYWIMRPQKKFDKKRYENQY